MRTFIIILVFLATAVQTIAQDFDISFSDNTPCVGDTVRISHPNNLASTWEVPTAFTIVGSVTNTQTLRIVCDSAGVYPITANDGVNSGTSDLSVYGVNANFEIVKGQLNAYKIMVKSNLQPAPYDRPYHFTWDFGDGTVTKDSILDANVENEYYSAQMYVYKDSGYFDISLAVENGNGCKAEYSVTDTISGQFSAPNVFTPNGDGVNDFFTARTNGNISFSMTVYSRWGNVVFETEAPSNSVVWDGRLKGGRKVSSGVYYYVIVPENEELNEKLTGFVHVFTEKE
ncbi:MAG: gliding motility-associated C-terminal domain-containing protein [Salinivirgaceae bacterium]|jgi:gliding motility-associated-like protein|nr:gliding motility-associated C-terminal domain-containing protein [Salinivirgaceae bacterium]